MQIHQRKLNLLAGRVNNEKNATWTPTRRMKTCSRASKHQGTSSVWTPPPSHKPRVCSWGCWTATRCFQHVTAANEAEMEEGEEAPLFVGAVITSPHGNDTKTTNDWWIVHELCFALFFFFVARACLCVCVPWLICVSRFPCVRVESL